MIIIEAAKKVRGYVCIRLDGYFIERFINLCIQRNIMIWDVHRIGETRVTAKVSTKEFKAMRRAAKKTSTNVRIVKKVGVPFFMYRYRKRKIATVGFLLFVLILWYCSVHIMGIDINGNSKIPTQQIMNKLSDFGIKYGKSVNGIDKRMIQNQMMNSFSDMAWIGIRINGSRIYVEVKERIEKPKSINEGVPCNIIAEKDGVICGLKVCEGMTVVKINDMVEKGDLLVSGMMSSNAEGIRYVHSYGEVTAKTWYKKTKKYPLVYKEKVKTGNNKRKYSINFMNKEIKLYLNKKIPYEIYKKTESKKEYKIPSEIFPSLYINCTQYDEEKSINKKRTEKQAFEIAKKELTGELKKTVPKTAKVKNTTVKNNKISDNLIEVCVEFECIENIAKQSKIDKIDILNYDIDNGITLDKNER